MGNLHNVFRHLAAKYLGSSAELGVSTPAAFNWDRLPPIVEPTYYKAYNPELQNFSDADLITHFEERGQTQGLVANRLTKRADFVALIPDDLDVLEIGPFCRPMKKGPKVKYFDVLDKQGLTTRRDKLRKPGQSEVPDIDYVSPTGDLGIIDDQFDCILSSHALEHQPDLIAHLKGIERLLRPGGAYFVVVPDKRYCLDHFQSTSTIIEVIDAHITGRKVHSIKSVIEHWTLATHNDRERHWNGDHGNVQANELTNKFKDIIKKYEEAGEEYIDVHAWYFTPKSCRQIMTLLRELDFISMEVATVYPTLQNGIEFWFVLRKP